jgi:hypothetical protein
MFMFHHNCRPYGQSGSPDIASSVGGTVY